MSILKRGALGTYTSVHVLALVCDCLSTEALRVAMCQVPQTLEATLATTSGKKFCVWTHRLHPDAPGARDALDALDATLAVHIPLPTQNAQAM